MAKTRRNQRLMTVLYFVLTLLVFAGLALFARRDQPPELDADYAARHFSVSAGMTFERDETGLLMAIDYTAKLNTDFQLTLGDEALIEQIDDVEAVTFLSQLPITDLDYAGQRYLGVTVMASDDDYPAVARHHLQAGRYLQEEESVPVTVISQSLFEELTADGFTLGDNLTIGTADYQVVGVLLNDSLAERIVGGFVSIERYAIVPFGVLPVDIASNASLDEINWLARIGADYTTVRKTVEDTITTNHGGIRDFSCASLSELNQFFSSGVSFQGNRIERTSEH